MQKYSLASDCFQHTHQKGADTFRLILGYNLDLIAIRSKSVSKRFDAESDKPVESGIAVIHVEAIVTESDWLFAGVVHDVDDYVTRRRRQQLGLLTSLVVPPLRLVIAV